jgi:hypothetical protein
MKTANLEKRVRGLGGARTPAEVMAIALDTIKHAFETHVGSMVVNRRSKR